MDWGPLGSPKGRVSLPPDHHPLPPFSPPPPAPPPFTQRYPENKISPSILLIIGILAVIFFISGLLHLLARCLLRATNRDQEDMGSATALQGQLQQLFHLHDAGVDQSFIDTLPVFHYKAVTGLKDPLDCAVCLCEFEADDELRLLPKCSHAFHLDCIDTWLLSHSTCPLCRRSLLPHPSPSCSPVVLVLESGSESPIGPGSDRRDSWPNPHPGSLGEAEFGPSVHADSPKPGEIEVKEDMGRAISEVSAAKVVPVKLGKFRNVDVAAAAGGEGTSGGSSDLSGRRCFSMGSFEYVMDEYSLLQVAIKPPEKRPRVTRPGLRLALSECDCHSKRDACKEYDRSRISESGGARIDPHKRESFSFSKIWLRSKKESRITDDGSARAFSLRLPLYRGATDESKVNCGSSRRTVSEFDVAGWMKGGSDFGSDAEAGSCNNSIGSRGEEAPSFARRTLLWIAGRQNKVVNHV